MADYEQKSRQTNEEPTAAQTPTEYRKHGCREQEQGQAVAKPFSADDDVAFVDLDESFPLLSRYVPVFRYRSPFSFLPYHV